MEVRTPGPADISGLRNTLNGLGVGEVSLQEFGADRELLIRIQRQTGDEAAQIKATNLFREALGPGVEYRRTEFRSEEHTSELQSLMRISYAVFCLKKNTKTTKRKRYYTHITR